MALLGWGMARSAAAGLVMAGSVTAAGPGTSGLAPGGRPSPNLRPPNRRLRKLLKPKLRRPRSAPPRALPRSLRPPWPRKCRGFRKHRNRHGCLSLDGRLSPDRCLSRNEVPSRNPRLLRLRPRLRIPRLRRLPWCLRLQPRLRLRRPRPCLRARGNPRASRRGARAGRQRAASGLRFPPGTRSCSAVRGSETKRHRTPRLLGTDSRACALGTRHHEVDSVAEIGVRPPRHTDGTVYPCEAWALCEC